MKLVKFQNINMVYLVIALALYAVLATYAAMDYIAITAPPWDYCGIHQTKAGTAFDCIRFGTDVVIIK